jgi:hypothetical protein
MATDAQDEEDRGFIFHPVVFSPLDVFDPSFPAPVRSKV